MDLNKEKQRLSKEKQFYNNSSFKDSITWEEYLKCQCRFCNREHCIHKDAFRRYPRRAGGLGLCENLK